MHALSNQELTIGALSKVVKQSEKALYDHLEALHKHGNLIIVAAECRKCGYVFQERNRVRKPGKCPKCKSTWIDEPLFTMHTD